MVYKGLKPELEEIVNQLQVGDGIVIEHTPDYKVRKSIRYIYNKGEDKLTLIGEKDHRINQKTIEIGIGPLYFCKYDSIKNIKIVDPVNPGNNI